jgi:23S rRNA (cytosine1962-C5)-methyltransferase
MNKLILHPAREKSLLRRHPWVFAGAVKSVVGKPAMGEPVEVWSADGEFLAVAGYSPLSQIRARVWDWHRGTQINETFFTSRVRRAYDLRASLALRTNAYRLLNAESDLLPGVIADRYGAVIVVQFLTAPADFHKREIAHALASLPGIESVYERSDADVRGKEGLPESNGLLSGQTPLDLTEVFERNADGTQWRFVVDVAGGHKTGFYLDQRENRQVLRQVVQDLAQNASSELTVLNCYSYSGAFAVASYAGGAKRVVNVDSAAPTLAWAKQNLQLNHFPAAEEDLIAADVPGYLRKMRDAARRFDVIVLDPPKFVQNQSQLERATRAYKDINLQAFHLLRPGGVLLTFSCSGLLSPDLFQKVVFGAASDAKRDVQVLQWLGQAADHPTLLNFPEGHYLKGLVCRAL